MSAPASTNAAQDHASGSSSAGSLPTMTEGSTLSGTRLSSENGEMRLSQDPSASTETASMLNNWLNATGDNVTVSETLCAKNQLELDD